MKKILASLLALLMILSSVGTMVSCDLGSNQGIVGDDGDKPEQTTTEETTTREETTTVEETTTEETTTVEETTTLEETTTEETTVEETTTEEHYCYFLWQRPSDEYLASPADCHNAAQYYYCCDCGAHGEETFSYGDPLGHRDFIVIDGFEANCTETGLTAGQKCGVCGDITVEQEIIPTNAKHEYENGVCIRCNVSSPSEGLEYQYTDYGYYVTGMGTCTDREIVIPAEYNGSPVIGIREMAFAYNKLIVKVTLPETLEVIQNNAFAECENLVEIYNLSNMSISVDDGWNSYGQLVRYAKNVYTKAEGESILVYQDDFIFCKFEDGYRLIGYTGNSEEITLPDTLKVADEVVEGYCIGVWAFAWNKTVKNVIIPDCVTGIMGSAFYACEALEGVNIGNGVQFINEYVFSYSGLKSIEIPESVKRIGYYAFLQNRALETVTLNEGLESINDGAFTNCSALKSITIPNSVTYIGYGILEHCIALESFAVGEDCAVSIPASTLGDCTALVSVALNNATTEISDEMFKGCAQLQSVKLGNNVTRICNAAFYGCSSLVSIEIPETVTEIAGSAFYRCSSLGSVTIGPNVESIGSDAFSYCTSLKEIVIPDSVKNFGGSMFYGCTELKSVKLGNGIDNIGSNMFSGCTALESVELSDGITEIGYGAFKDCASIKEIVISASVEKIAEGAFAGCSSLESITLPFIGAKKTEAAGYPLGYIFGTYDYEGAVQVSQNRYFSSGGYEKHYYYIPETLVSVTVTGPYVSAGAFENCRNIKQVTLPEGLQTVGKQMFYMASGLESVNIPSTVTVVDSLAFGYCNALTRVDIASVEAWCGIAFANKMANPLSNGAVLYLGGEVLTDVEVPEGIENIGKFAFAGCTSIESISLPASLKTIEESAFDGCTALAKVRVADLGAWCGVFVTIEKSSPFVSGAALYVGDSEEPVTKLEIPYGVTAIQRYNFAGCTVESVYIPETVRNIGMSAFTGCNIKNVYIDNLTAWYGIYFEDEKANPMFNGANLYVGGEMMTEAVIPAGTTRIADGAFKGCTSITEVVIPDGVQYVGADAFAGCVNLKKLVVPDSIINLPTSAFAGCDNIEYMEGPERAFYSINKNALKEAVITSGDSIGYQLFYGCIKLEKVTLPEGITYIGREAFRNCAITKIIIPDSVTHIDSEAFKDCSRLTHVTLGANLRTISDYAFQSTILLREICNRSALVINKYEVGGNGCSEYGYIGEGAKRIYNDGNSNIIAQDGFLFFYDAANDAYELLCDEELAAELVLPASVNGKTYSISDRAFWCRYDLTSVTISDGVTAIGDSAFTQCTNLKYVNTPSSVEYVGWNTFQKCTSLFEIVDGVYYVDKWAVNFDAKTVVDLVVREGTVGIAPYAFNRGSRHNVKTFTVPTTLKYIGHDAFGEYFTPDSLYISDIAAWCNVQRGTGYSNAMAYSRVGNLYVDGELVKDLVIPEGVKKIGHDAFLGLNIESVKLPTTLEIIEYEAFYKCTKLKSVEFNSTVRMIGSYAFYGCTQLTTINLPDGLLRIESTLFQNCLALKSITIPKTVTYIGVWAFNGSGVKDIYFTGTKSQWDAITKDTQWSPSGSYTVHCTDDN